MQANKHLLGRRVGGLVTVAHSGGTLIACGIEGEARCSLQFRAEMLMEQQHAMDEGMGMDGARSA